MINVSQYVRCIWLQKLFFLPKRNFLVTFCEVIFKTIGSSRYLQLAPKFWCKLSNKSLTSYQCVFCKVFHLDLKFFNQFEIYCLRNKSELFWDVFLPTDSTIWHEHKCSQWKPVARMHYCSTGLTTHSKVPWEQPGLKVRLFKSYSPLMKLRHVFRNSK